VGRSTISRILKAQGLPPVPERPTSWLSFLKAHWAIITGADFFTTEVWMWQGLITYVYTVFVIDLASCRVQVVGSTPHPGDLFMCQVGRTRVAQTPLQAPKTNAYAERFVRSIREECLDRTIPIGERHFPRAIREFVDHYDHERNHQALGNALIDGVDPPDDEFAVARGSVDCSITTNGRVIGRVELWDITR
jgi:Integrase core domain